MQIWGGVSVVSNEDVNEAREEMGYIDRFLV